MSLQGLLEQALHSYQYGTLTNQELRVIMMIKEHADAKLKENPNERNYDETCDVYFNGKKCEKLEGEL